MDRLIGDLFCFLGGKMCKHEFIKINDIIVCKRCGMTKTPGGKIIFDRKVINHKSNRRK